LKGDFKRKPKFSSVCREELQ